MSAHQFKAGDPVVCINADFTQIFGASELEEGRVYTVAWIGPYLHPMFGEFIGVRLIGVSRPAGSLEEEAWYAEFGETPFHHSRFRPVQKRATDISIFQSLLTPTPSEIADIQLEDSVAEFEELVHLGEDLLK